MRHTVFTSKLERSGQIVPAEQFGQSAKANADGLAALRADSRPFSSASRSIFTKDAENRLGGPDTEDRCFF